MLAVGEVDITYSVDACRDPAAVTVFVASDEQHPNMNGDKR